MLVLSIILVICLRPVPEFFLQLSAQDVILIYLLLDLLIIFQNQQSWHLILFSQLSLKFILVLHENILSVTQQALPAPSGFTFRHLELTLSEHFPCVLNVPVLSKSLVHDLGCLPQSKFSALFLLLIVLEVKLSRAVIVMDICISHGQTGLGRVYRLESFLVEFVEWCTFLISE